MATIVLSAVGMAVGGSIGGAVAGLPLAVVGRAVGAAVGQRIDQKLLGSGSEPVEVGAVDRFRLTGAGEGTDIQTVFGRMRVSGHVIWASQFLETSETTGGGKGTPAAPKTTTYAYQVSLAIALGEGAVSRIGRIWADGVEISRADLDMRLYHGTADQQPDPKIAAVEGTANTPAFRGTAYVVFEDLGLAQFGNRVPQFTFEVHRTMQPDHAPEALELPALVNGVALIPGTGEYALATTPLYLSAGFGDQLAINTNSPLGGTDFTVSMDTLQEELPRCKSVVMVVSWFGDDLRCGECSVLPKVEPASIDASGMPWRVSGLTRETAPRIPETAGRAVYGGTPTDASVVEALQDMTARGLEPVFYPFILMDQLAGNTLPDPYSGGTGQAALPWRGRITTSRAPGVAGSPDGTATAAAQVAAFMGDAAVSDFTVEGTEVSYTGSGTGGYRRFILHYAHLCKAAGGVAAFCIGSEMRGLTQIRGAGNSFPAVAALQTLAADVRAILGPDCKISYAADWSEYHGYQPAGTADKFFHLDPLWADPNIDFIGVDNYLPLSDWRNGDDHADSGFGSIYNLDYLAGNVAGGEGYDWYYPTPEARDAQRRVPITDGEGQPWIWRPKDFRGWWENQHHDRIGGQRAAQPTPWIAKSKPIWFTEFGCAAIDKGANQPNKFIDTKSSESGLPYYSDGQRDDFMQMQYLRAVYRHFTDPDRNPLSTEYEGRMVAVDRMHVWAWDSRPFPFFPGNRSLWSDAENYSRGHWLNGRMAHRPLAAVVAEICTRSGVTRFDVSRLYGVVRGYMLGHGMTARAALQPLMLAYGFDAMEREGTLVFENRSGRAPLVVTEDTLALNSDSDESLVLTRAPASEIAGRVQVSYLDADGDYEGVTSEAVIADPDSFGAARTDVPLALTRSEGQQTASRWIQEARIARDTASFALPPSQGAVHAGDVVRIATPDHNGLYRIDRVEEAGLRLVDAVRIDAELYRPQMAQDDGLVLKPFEAPVPVEMLFMDLPLLTGDEVPTAPYVAGAGQPWPGTVAVYTAPQDSDYVLQDLISDPSTVGLTETPLLRGPTGIWDRQAGLDIRMINGTLSSASIAAILSGKNTLAIGDGTSDQWEILQFRDAVPVAPRRFAVSGLLRGQAGSRGLMPDVWPAGSPVVLFDGRVQQMLLPTAARGNLRHIRFGPAKAAITAPSYRYETHVFHGNGLRPYPVAHLRVTPDAGALDVSWIRCSRIDGDLWTEGDIPLGEEVEQYRLRLRQDGVVKLEEIVDTPARRFSAATLQTALSAGPFAVEVAQLSARFGAGPVTSRTWSL